MIWTDELIEATAQYRVWMERMSRLSGHDVATIPAEVGLRIATRELEILKTVDPALWAERERATRFEALARAGRAPTIPGSMASWLRSRGYGDALIELGRGEARGYSEGTAVDLEHPCVDEHLRALVTRRAAADGVQAFVEASRRCRLCGGEIGPDVTDRPMCYDCGPYEMLPSAARTPERAARHYCDPLLRPSVGGPR